MSELPALAGSGEDFVDERSWRAAPWETRPTLALPGEGAHVVVVSAHPDDEVLALGGTLALLADRGCRLTLVTATDGEGSHPGSRPGDPARMGPLRAVELEQALAALGVEAVPVRLGLPDSGLARCEPALREAIRSLVHDSDADLVVATWSRDGHPDHEAVGRACLAVAAGTHLPVWEAPVWAWHWAGPGDERFPWDRVHVVDVRDRLAVKADAVSRFASQIAPIGPDPQDGTVLPPEVLAHFARPYEAVLL